MRTDFSNTAAAGIDGEKERIRLARRGLLVFFAMLVPLGGISIGLLSLGGRNSDNEFNTVTMFGYTGILIEIQGIRGILQANNRPLSLRLQRMAGFLRQNRGQMLDCHGSYALGFRDIVV